MNFIITWHKWLDMHKTKVPVSKIKATLWGQRLEISYYLCICFMTLLFLCGFWNNFVQVFTIMKWCVMWGPRSLPPMSRSFFEARRLKLNVTCHLLIGFEVTWHKCSAYEMMCLKQDWGICLLGQGDSWRSKMKLEYIFMYAPELCYYLALMLTIMRHCVMHKNCVIHYGIWISVSGSIHL